MLRLIALPALLFAVVLPASAAEPSYGPWRQGGGDIQALIDELKALIDRAESVRAADPRFLGDLRDTIRRYETPWSVTILSDDFGDGDYTRNPAWTVHSGEFFIDWQRGLRSRVEPQVAAPTPAPTPTPTGKAAPAVVKPTEPVAVPYGDDVASPDYAIASGEIYSGVRKQLAFDDDPRTQWASDIDGHGNANRSFIGQDFGAGNAKHVRAIFLTQRQDSDNGNATSVDAQRWAGGRWETVASFAVAADGNRQLLRLPASGPSERWRVMTTAVNVRAAGAYWHVAELAFLEEAITAAQTPPETPAPSPGAEPAQPATIEDFATGILKQILKGGPPKSNLVWGPPTEAEEAAAGPQAQVAPTPAPVPTATPAAAPAPARTERAEISTAVKITNAFSIRLELSSLGDEGRLVFGPYQGTRRAIGYRLAYSPGRQPSLELVSVSGRGVRVIDVHEAALAPDSGKPRRLEWNRGPDGTMTVAVDGQELMRVADRGLRP
jgi:hypothetical protein